jgi:hypothetical protein
MVKGAEYGRTINPPINSRSGDPGHQQQGIIITRKRKEIKNAFHEIIVQREVGS